MEKELKALQKACKHLIAAKNIYKQFRETWYRFAPPDINLELTQGWYNPAEEALAELLGVLRERVIHAANLLVAATE